MVLVLVLVLACAGKPASDTGWPTDCDTRTGGGFVQFTIQGDAWSTWTTDAAFLDEAKTFVAVAPAQAAPIFGAVIAGRDCDSHWVWHVDPAQAAWSDTFDPVCDEMPSIVEDNLTTWLASPGNYCPAEAVVVSVDDRR